MRRYSAVPWLADDSDLSPMGSPEASVEMPGDLTLGLLIPHPFGKDADAMLAIHAHETPDDPGGIITLAITTIVERTTKAMDMTLLSNPRRYEDAE